jgi:hypothetical protein
VRISSDIRILCTIGNELKKTATHYVYILGG